MGNVMNIPKHSSETTNDYIIVGRDDEIIGFNGTFLAFASSKRDMHDHNVQHVVYDNGQSYAPPRSRCSACRWFEVTIYRVNEEFILPEGASVGIIDDMSDYEVIDRRGRYLVVTAGVSVVPNEVIMRRTSWTDSPYEVVELLTQRRGSRPFLPTPSARALSQAAAWDSGIQSAYIDRAVA